MVSTSENDIRRYIIEELAAIRATDIASIETEIASNAGDMEIDSVQAVSVLGGLEGRLHRQLPGIEDIDPKQLTSMRKLTELAIKGLAEVHQ
jgi:acyl carrier protein